MQIQQPNIATFTKADYKLLQQMSDNDDLIKNNIEKSPKGIVTLGLLDNVANNLPNYSSTFGSYQKYDSVDWLNATFIDPKTSRLITNFESNRYYKFIVHLDYVWAANNLNQSTGGDSGRIEIRLRDMTHRHDLLYWTNVVDPDYNMGGITPAPENYVALRDKTYNASVNIWDWGQASAAGTVPSSCHAVRVMAAKTSGAAVLKLQYRPMKAYGGIIPPEVMDCSGGQPIYGLPTQYIDNTGTAKKTETIKQFKGYVAVEDCGPTEKPAGVEPGVQNDNSVSPLFEAFENHPYNSTLPERP